MPVSTFARNGNFLGLLAANTVLGSAMPMLIILGGLAGLMLAPTAALATIPASVQTLAGLFAAAPFSLLMGRLGRKAGFLIGGALALLGALIGTWAMMSDSFILLCVAHLALGAALSCFQYFRFAAAEVVSPEWQPVAISLMLTSGLIAAFVGPQVFILAKDALSPIPLAGAYAAIGAVSLIGLSPLAFVHIPTPKPSPQHRSGGRFAALAVLKQRPVRTAVGIGAVSQGIMVFLMVPTPLAMIGCGFSEAAAGDVIRWHVVAMFAPSFFTGFLIKRFGTWHISMIGLALLVMAAISAATGLSSAHFYGALILLGVGWNFGFIGATTMLANVVSADEKSVVQGVNDTIIALVSTVCAFAAGTIIAGFGWAPLAIVAAVVLTIALGSMMLAKRQSSFEGRSEL
ncbi:MFS transporter [Sulfitobacter sp. SK012]|uniref:MFS transporter n=1 Tax=Sulfitobacter sp. SK012 TaxID=1389005 RepID=UPI000E0B2625|nr:MFS transporter [Sulfitobacter sp. SK012]AXI48490.1 MFS transporter [Sulfitobacter sp. SK012]